MPCPALSGFLGCRSVRCVQPTRRYPAFFKTSTTHSLTTSFSLPRHRSLVPSTHPLDFVSRFPAYLTCLLPSPHPPPTGPAAPMPRAAASRDTPAGSRDGGLPYPAEDLSEDDDLFSFLLVDQLGMRAQTKLGVHPQQVKFVGPAHNREDVLTILREVSVAARQQQHRNLQGRLSFTSHRSLDQPADNPPDRAERYGSQPCSAEVGRVSVCGMMRSARN